MVRIVFVCQLYHALFIIVDRYFSLLFVYFVRLFNFICSLFDFCLIQFFCFSLFIVGKKKDSILILECIPGILILLYHCTRIP
jgi:hypothetical protein